MQTPDTVTIAVIALAAAEVATVLAIEVAEAVDREFVRVDVVNDYRLVPGARDSPDVHEVRVVHVASAITDDAGSRVGRCSPQWQPEDQ